MDQPESELDGLAPGQVLENEDGKHFIVLVVDDSGENALLGPLVTATLWPPDPTQIRATKTYWTTLKSIAHWKHAYFDGPRLVRGYARDHNKVLWEAYVPDFFTALRLADELNADEKRLVDLEIIPQHMDEVESLDDHGHFSEIPDPPPMEIPDAQYFDAVTGSMTAKSGDLLYLQTRRVSGEEAWLAFPHSEIANLVETASMQMGRGRDPDGKGLKDAFKASGFKLGRGPANELVLSIRVGVGGELNFLLSQEFADELVKGMVRK